MSCTCLCLLLGLHSFLHDALPILYKQGESKKSMARILGISRNTVKAYLNKLSALDADIDILLTMEDSELEKQFHAGRDRKSTRLNSSHVAILYAVFC